MTGHAIGGVNHGPMPKLGRLLCCRLQLSWLPVSSSSEGEIQSCCIVIGIVVEHIYKPAVLAMFCMECTAPTSWSVGDSRTQPLGPNHGLCCRCQNWRHFPMVMLTSARQTKQKIVGSLWNTSAYNLIYGGGCSRSRVCACVCEGVPVSVSCRNCHNLLYGSESKLETLLCGDANFRSTNKLEVLIVISVQTQEIISCCTVTDARYRIGCSFPRLQFESQRLLHRLLFVR